MPRKLCGSVRWSRHRKDGVPSKLCGSVRSSKRRKDGVPRQLVEPRQVLLLAKRVRQLRFGTMQGFKEATLMLL